MSCEKSQLQPSYDGFSHLIQSINATPAALVAMFTIYCDDSGTHSKSDVAVAGCYISTVDQWTELKRNWEAVNEREKFGVFHMSDFVAKKENFSSPEWNDQIKRDRTIQALINLIKTRAQCGFAAVVTKSAYDQVVVDGGLKHRYGDNHYAFAVRLCTAMVNRWRDKYRATEPIQYIFDRMSEGKGDIDKLFKTLVKGGEDAMRRYGVFKDCWSFQDKAQVTQLQAADIWAWENYKYMIDCFVPSRSGGMICKRPRLSYLALTSSPTVVKYHTRDTLEELVRRMPEWAFA
jgi:Protein of unknown function (DUF3800)